MKPLIFLFLCSFASILSGASEIPFPIQARPFQTQVYDPESKLDPTVKTTLETLLSEHKKLASEEILFWVKSGSDADNEAKMTDEKGIELIAKWEVGLRNQNQGLLWVYDTVSGKTFTRASFALAPEIEETNWKATLKIREGLKDPSEPLARLEDFFEIIQSPLLLNDDILKLIEDTKEKMKTQNASLSNGETGAGSGVINGRLGLSVLILALGFSGLFWILSHRLNPDMEWSITEKKPAKLLLSLKSRMAAKNSQNRGGAVRGKF